VSELHANFILTGDGAKAADVEQLIHLIRETVKQKTGVELETEVRVVGEPGRKPGIGNEESGGITS
jgi:UDP-N-acetylmuramate dehydrogenase